MKKLEILKAFINNNRRGKTFSVGWILSGNEKNGSSRIHGINLHFGLKEAGISSYLLQIPAEWTEKLDLTGIEKLLIKFSSIDIVIFQRVYGSDSIKFCRILQQRGVLCGFFMADMYQTDMLNEVSFILTPSEHLKRLLITGGVNPEMVFVLPDAVETAPELRKSYEVHTLEVEKKIKLVWVGIQGHWETLDLIRRLLKQNDQLRNYELVTISNHPKADINWRLDTVWDEILACDIGIVPVDLANTRSIVKSNNRVTMFMALAMPVICSPIPSYSKIIIHNKNGFLASDEAEWVTFLLKLSDPYLRKQIGETAHEYAHSEYSRKSITNRLIKVLDKF